MIDQLYATKTEAFEAGKLVGQYIKHPMDARDRARAGVVMMEIVNALAFVHPDDREIRRIRELVRMFVEERDIPEPDHPGDRP